MAYFAAVKITDINGNVVELTDVSELLEEVHTELKAIHKVLEEHTGITVEKEDIND